MPLPENLQFLRARSGVTQEQLAERLDVSRQSVSKWESGSAYPEMDTLLKLCNMFHIDLDTLLRGDAAQVLAEDSAGYDDFMTSFARRIAGAVAGIIASAGLGAAVGNLVHPEELGGFILLLGITIAVVVLSSPASSTTISASAIPPSKTSIPRPGGTIFSAGSSGTSPGAWEPSSSPSQPCAWPSLSCRNGSHTSPWRARSSC